MGARIYVPETNNQIRTERTFACGETSDQATEKAETRKCASEPASERAPFAAGAVAPDGAHTNDRGVGAMNAKRDGRSGEWIPALALALPLHGHVAPAVGGAINAKILRRRNHRHLRVLRRGNGRRLPREAVQSFKVSKSQLFQVLKFQNSTI